MNLTGEGPANTGPSLHFIHEWKLEYNKDIADWVESMHASDKDVFSLVNISDKQILVQIPSELFSFPGAEQWRNLLWHYHQNGVFSEYRKFSTVSTPIQLRVAQCHTNSKETLRILCGVADELIMLIISPGDPAGFDVKIAYIMDRIFFERISGLSIIEIQDTIFDGSDPSTIATGVSQVIEATGAAGAAEAISLGVRSKREQIRRVNIKKKGPS